MSGPVNPPLTVTDTDGSPSIRPCRTITFDSTDFTVVDNGSGNARIVASASAGSSLTDSYVGFGSASNLLTGSANFTFVDETGGDGPTLTLSGDKPRFDMQDDSDPTDYKTRFEQSGASLFLLGQDSGGNSTEMIRAQPTSVVINDDGADMDFRHEASGGGALLWSDAGRSAVGIGTQPGSGVERLHIKGTGNETLVQLESTDTSAAYTAPDLVLLRNPSDGSASDGDFIGTIDYKGLMTGGSSVGYYTRLITKILDADSATGSGMFALQAADGAAPNVNNSQLIIYGRTGAPGYTGPGMVSINTAKKDVDTRISGDTETNLIYADASQDNVGIACEADSGVERLHVKGTGGTEPMVRIESSGTGSADAPILELYSEGADDDADNLGGISWYGKDAGGNRTEYARIEADIKDSVEGTEDGRVKFHAISDGAELEFFRYERGAITFNELGANIDFRIEGDSVPSLFRTDASQDNIGIGGLPDSNVERLHIKGTSTGTLVRMESTDDGATAAPTLEFYRNSASAASSDYLSKIYHTGNNASGVAHVYIQEASYIVDATDGQEDALVYWQVMTDGTLREKLRLRENMVEVNAPGRSDCDFRVRGDTTSDLFFCDASQENVGVGATPASGGPQLQVNDDASFLLPVEAYTANHDITVAQAHGYALTMKTSVGTGTFTLPEIASIGMHVELINLGSGMNVTVDASSSHQINSGGSAGNSTAATVTNIGAGYNLVYVASNAWICTVNTPAVVS